MKRRRGEGPQACVPTCGEGGACVLSCDVRRATQRHLRVTPAGIAELRELQGQSVERAGTLVPDLDAGVLRVNVKAGGGKKAEVQLPFGAWVFHTHPNACDSEESCFHETPSPEDMELVARDAAAGDAIGHVVVGATGVYTYTPSMPLRVRFVSGGTSSEEVRRRFEEFYAPMDTLATETVRKGGDGNAVVRRKWLAFARGQGFKVQYAPWPSAAAALSRTVTVRPAAAEGP